MSDSLESPASRQVTFQTSQGLALDGTALRLSRYGATFELYAPETPLRTSEVLDRFVVQLRQKPVYSGRAVVQEIINTGTATVCSVLLEDAAFDSEFFASLGQTGQLGCRFDEFVREWQGICAVRPEFKLALADIQTFLIDLRRWMEQVELGIRSSPRLGRVEQERAIIAELAPQVLPVLDTLFGKYELAAAGLGAAEVPVHRSYVQRHLHPLVLCAPFAYRSYTKPLGYAGDYEMVNMMLRDPQEGSSLFAKVFNVWLLHQGSAAAHRNRITFLTQRLLEVTAAAVRAGRKARILNLGCGPAWEIQRFLAQSALSNDAQFTLMDFNDETLDYTSRLLRLKQEEHNRRTAIHLVKKSAAHLLKDALRPDGFRTGQQYDFIYCAGLFDYLPDRTCSQLLGLFYRSLLPGGLMLATNVAPATPNRASLELILDWHLIYRNAAQFAALCRDMVPADTLQIYADETFFNVILEARKTDDR